MEMPADEDHTLNVQAVEMRTGVTAETLRTWERRYGWPRPRRLPNGYRVYSEDDVAMIQAVKRELDSGVAAATAWQRVLAARQRRPESELAVSPQRLCTELASALLNFDAEAAQLLLTQAHAIYPLERVLTEVLRPTLVEIGGRWHDGTASVAQEHFCSNLLRDHLVTIGNFYRPKPSAPMIVIGSGPGELHDIGPLMISVILRRNRCKVLYLGQNTSLEQLPVALEQLRPRMLVLAASRLETARHLLAVPREIQKMSQPRPLFVFGGRGFDGHREVAEQIPGIYVEGDIVQVAERIEELVSERRR